jgi:FAD:protein FMN transferase
MPSVFPKARRSRPLLGTFVEIQAEGLDSDLLHQAIEKAFAAVAIVQQLLSFHDPTSELSLLNRTAGGPPLRLHAWTWQVLKAAVALQIESKGAFNVAIAEPLLRWGYLPRHSPKTNHSSEEGELAIELQADQKARLTSSRGKIDLGGIAKGFAVDCAVNALIENGVPMGIVNAGGDLRVFGEHRFSIWLRDKNGAIEKQIQLQNTALATSGTYWSERPFAGRRVSPLINPQTQDSSLEIRTVSVRAPICLWADALTKVIINLGENGFPLLRKYGAESFFVPQEGEPRYSAGWDEETWH